MLLYILRHGQTEYNRLAIVQGSGVDSDLNETGRAQANAFYSRYASVNFDIVVTSALKRTHQTVSPFLEKGLPWIQNAWINEISWGDHEGLSATPDLMVEYERVIDAWRANDLDASLPNGETARQLGARLEQFIAWLHTKPAERMLICTHGRTMRAFITLLKGLPLSKMEGTPHHNTGCYIARLEEGQFVFLQENSIDHLEVVELPEEQLQRT
jgi:phosphoserine phosphatase